MSVLDKHEHDGGAYSCEPFSEAAERITNAICSAPLPWIDCYGIASRHDSHLYDGACSICKAGHAPWALRIVIDAVLAAALADPDVARALTERARTDA